MGTSGTHSSQQRTISVGILSARRVEFCLDGENVLVATERSGLVVIGSEARPEWYFAAGCPQVPDSLEPLPGEDSRAVPGGVSRVVTGEDSRVVTGGDSRVVPCESEESRPQSEADGFAAKAGGGPVAPRRGAYFTLKNVEIGKGFHWQRRQDQTFPGDLRLIARDGLVIAINVVGIEDYLQCVIASEMSPTSGVEFLKAHAVISRSWLLAQLDKRDEVREGYSSVECDTPGELIRWQDREDHAWFDFCADDHCQRYQGITRAANTHVEDAVRQTRGQILMYDGEVCDARFSKCCGGATEEFQYCWEDTPKPYLSSVEDPFCNTNDKHVISQVLNDYDQETSDFYEWSVEYTRQELSDLVRKNLKIELGDITDLIPVERGKSGRISQLRIVGTERTFTIGKELEIRRVLSDTHLLSSNFEVKKIYDTNDANASLNGNLPQRFILHGKGWGHGVGLCQIGAAVMGEKGYLYNEILTYYYHNAEIKKIYK